MLSEVLHGTEWPLGGRLRRGEMPNQPSGLDVGNGLMQEFSQRQASNRVAPLRGDENSHPFDDVVELLRGESLNQRR